MCRNLALSGCIWLAPSEHGQCFACDLTRTRPNDDDATGLAKYPAAGRAKRHLVVEPDTLGFPLVGKHEDEDGLAFDLLSRSMGHDDLYPFVIPDTVLDKLEFVASLAPTD